MKELFVFLLVLLITTGCSSKTDVKNYKEVIKPVKYYTVVKSFEDNNLSFSGISIPQEQAKISFKISGNIKKIYVKLGDKVKKGQLLAEIDPEVYKLKLKEANIALNNMRAKARNAEASYRRIKALYEEQNVSRSDYEKALTMYEVSKTGISAILNKIRQAKLQLRYTVVKAPDNGIIAYILQKENENIAAGMPVVVLNYGKKTEVEIGVPETIINKIKQNMKAKVVFNTLKNKIFKSKVTKIGVSPKLNTPLFPVTVELEETDERILSGMVAKVKFNFNESNSKSKIIIPVLAVNEDNKSRYIYIIKNIENNIGIVKKIYVKTGKLSNKGFEILSGVKLGDKIVVAGVNKMKDNLKVRVLGE